MCLYHHISNDLIAVLLCHFSDSKETAKGFRHLLVVDIDVTVVHPVVRKWLSRCRLALCDFVFMVRKNQILSAAVQIQCFTEVMTRHSGTFNMPAWTTFSPWRFPVWFSWLCRFPDSKIQWAFLLIIHINPCSCL